MSQVAAQVATTQIRGSVSSEMRWAEILETVPARRQRYHPVIDQIRRTPSTGRFPPTPNPNAANSPQVPTQLGPPPTARPNTPARNKVVLNANRRPKRSAPMPQKEAPRHKPTNVAQVVYRTLLELTPNSDVNDGKVSATTWLVNQFRVSRLCWRLERT